ncbi:fluoride efflux transporter CrcB [Colwellia sp. 4_MG-2023]|jgi:CrcB protein|uniref:fluoride efflux transporter CrcB n=1 Tax=unclassified Colwellia TaxID=196834 RepID=UPI001C085BB7|nr:MULTISPECIES: fluoride efflux transporter CrcB [unclassified Colwellia]MBU2926075.1 fluoride efflux transporter CrcB [Colwellia sp. C2M11]MDO6487105.1 fluoride efflux transporter CrcB [Colwellia sp. 6_MG-2023]MDO6508540.1 fluoride efflux transporter CrcB [Colwellia sp. 5_MG-2023]MDO6557155.1 fluoride efflux transporter CrcB [Colwellia sp. 4_MG-2023]MDO6653216.1 fluoride efflux transporter CrcB [Colwellia sp. 3_MG-2023]
MNNAISNLTLYAFVALGGACGASLRFYISQLVLNWLGKGFPFATLMVNITGSFIMGLLYQLIEHEILDINVHRTLIGIGFLGAFTTFSTFSLDSLLLIQQGDLLKAGINIILNVSLCIAAAGLGLYLVSAIAK